MMFPVPLLMLFTSLKHIRFARVSSHLVDFNASNKRSKAKPLQQRYRYHKFPKAISKFYRRHFELVSKYNTGLRLLLH